MSIEGLSDEDSNKEGLRKNYMNFLIDSYEGGYFQYYVDEETKQRYVKFKNEAPVLASEVTISKLKEFANQRHYKPAKDYIPEGTVIKESMQDTVQLGEYFKGEDGNIYEVVGPRRSFRNWQHKGSLAKMTDLIYRVPGKIVNGKLTKGVRITLGQHIKNVGYTNLVPTGEGKLIGLGGYLAFKPGFEQLIEQTEATPKIDVQKWRSLPARNSSEAKTKKQNETALNWWNNNPLSKVIGVNFLNEASEFGPNFVANFIGNAINLYKGSSSTDLYHEAFHAFFDGILTPSERNDIYNTLRKTPGYFKAVVNGVSKVVPYSHATSIEFEEFLAEKFKNNPTLFYQNSYAC